MADKVLFKRGIESHTPLLDIGEPFVTKDTQKFLYGTPQGNVEVAKQMDVATKANQTDMDSVTTKLSEIAYKPENYKLPADADYTSAFSKIMTAIGTNGGSIYLAQGKTYTGDIVITTSNVNVYGKGTLKGKIRVEGQIFADENLRYNGTRNITVNQITIDGEGTRDGITLQYAYGITISGVYFKDCLKSVSVNTIDYFQHVSRLEINNNHFLNCQYGYYVDRGSSTKYICGDVKFNNNIDESTNNNLVSRINTIHANGQDGIIINGNVSFGGSGLVTNVDINNANFVIVDSNNLFAPTQNCVSIKNSFHITVRGNNCPWSMGDTIFLDNCTTYNINGNNISWYEMTGQSGFVGAGILVQNNQNGYGNISSNNIVFPYKQGIKLVTSGKNTVANNTIKNLNSTDEAIYADGEYNYVNGNCCYDFTKVNTVTGYNSQQVNTYTGA